MLLHSNYFMHVMFRTNYICACRSAVSDADEWPSKYSKFFIEVGVVAPLMCGNLEWLNALFILLFGLVNFYN